METNQTPTSTIKLLRDARCGAFVLGRNAFTRVSAVEKIVPSPDLEAELRRMRDATPDQRRAKLAAEYGKG